MADGLTEVLTVDRPENVVYLNDEQVARFGPLAELRAAGEANLRQVQWDHELVAHEGGRLDVLTGDSFFVASMLLVLPQVLRRLDRTVDPDLGIFLAAPNRSTLLLHVIADSSAIASLHLLTTVAAGMYDELPGVLSPDAYWWRPSGLLRISKRTADSIDVDLNPDLAAVLNRVT